MSGHSKWSKIKRQKGTADQRRGRLFSKIAKLISVSARSGGDPEANPRLASAVAKAKEINMTKDTIEKAIKKGTGEDELGGQFEEFTLEAVGTGGVGILIECTSDNKNRTLSEIKKLLEKAGWSLAEGGAISWQFESKGLVTIPLVKERMELKEWQKDVKERKALISDELESFELSLIEVDGVLDVKREDDVVEVFTTPKSVGRVAKSISEDLNYVVDSYEIIQIPKTPLSVDEVVRQKVDEVIELLEDHEDVQTVWANVSLA